MTRQGKQIPPSMEKGKNARHKNEIWTIDTQKPMDPPYKEIDVNANQATGNEKELNEKSISTARNALFQLDLDAIIRMKKDLADRCCCADVPCVSIVKEYCESR